jgi:uncharacterized UBP type Zn finger protein
MKTETLINTGIGLALFGFLCTVGLLVIMREDNPKPEIQKPQVQKYDSCGWCRAVKPYSLNVSVCHYGDSVGE